MDGSSVWETGVGVLTEFRNVPNSPGEGPDAAVPGRWRFATACFDESALTLTVAGQAVALDRRTLQMLALLLRHAGEIVTKDEILDKVWPDREVTEASLTKAVARLRQGLGDAEHTILRTVHGYGYRLAVPVAQESGAADRAAPAVALTAGDMVAGRPNWRLVRRLGAGGYGDVWLAAQAKSGAQRVFKFAAHGAGLAALRREVTVGRLLRQGLGPRADLVPVLDWRLDEPPAFVEIDFFAQGNLAEWAQAQGGVTAIPLGDRLEFVAQIADTLAAIHGMAVLHTDLKPANVLVRLDAAGRPAMTLTDFGSSRALDPSRLERLGITRMDGMTGADSTAGTQMYCAPEILAGGVPSVLADVFSLGVMLFQLAAGDLTRGLAPGWEADIADPLLCEDIALAASGDPNKRLADAAELARRLRDLTERAEARKRAEAAQAEALRTRRALELARARRTPLLALLGVLVAALAGSFTLYLRAEREAARAKTVTRFLTEDLLSAANPALAADPNVPVSKVLAAAAADLDKRFVGGSPDRAVIEAAVGSAYAGLADPDRALPLLRAALATFRQRLGEDDPQTQAVRLAMAALAERIVDSAGMRAAGQAILAAGRSDAATTLAARYYVLAADYLANGDAEVCAAAARTLLDDSRHALGAAHPDSVRVQSELAWCLADGLHFTEAIPLARDAVARTQAAFGPDHLLVQERRFVLGGVLVQAERNDEAIGLLTDVHQRMLALSGAETEMSARVLNQLGMAHNQAGHLAEAEAFYRQVLAFSVRSRGARADLSEAALGNLASVLVRMGRATEAAGLARQAFEVERDREGADAAATLWAENNLADDLAKSGDLAGGEALFLDIVARGRRIFSHGEWDLGVFLYHLGSVMAQEGKVEQARAMLGESVAVLEARLGAGDARTARARAALAGVR